jgi:hypothetical protein
MSEPRLNDYAAEQDRVPPTLANVIEQLSESLVKASSLRGSLVNTGIRIARNGERDSVAAPKPETVRRETLQGTELRPTG